MTAWLSRGRCGRSYRRETVLMASKNNRRSLGTLRDQGAANNTGQTTEGSFAVIQARFMHTNLIIPVNTKELAILATLPHSAGGMQEITLQHLLVVPTHRSRTLYHPTHPKGGDGPHL